MALTLALFISWRLTYHRIVLELSNEFFLSVIATFTVVILVFYLLGVYKTVVRFLDITVLTSIFSGLLAGSSFIYLLFRYQDGLRPLALSMVFFASTMLIIAGTRLVLRSLLRLMQPTAFKHVIIYGAGAAGRQLAAALKRGFEYIPVAFIDDDNALQGTKIEGLEVFPSKKALKIIHKYKVSNILLAMPGNSMQKQKRILESLVSLPVEVKSLPGFADLVSGKAKIDEIRDVNVEELLGRDTVSPNENLLTKCIRHKNVMVTGAGGSIGSELCRQIINLSPNTLILFDVSEYSLYQIEQELLQNNINNVRIMAILGSVQNHSRLLSSIQHFQIHTLYHAAAYKHVPMVEQNTVEGVRNNIFGTLNTATAAAQHQVENFVLISTDKAVRPTNTMGATKRTAELILQALTHEYPSTMFSMVRFGNVLGSSGSVVPLFHKQIRNGGPITVTDPKIIRYFMTIPEAALLVIQAGSMAKGGDVFVLDMGEPVLITELARRMIRLSGLQEKSDTNPEGDIEIKYTGLRPGEKLYEELIVGGDNVQDTQHPRIMTAEEKFWHWDKLKSFLERLDSACTKKDQTQIRNLLLEAPLDFAPSSEICDHVLIQFNSHSNATESV